MRPALILLCLVIAGDTLADCGDDDSEPLDTSFIAVFDEFSVDQDVISWWSERWLKRPAKGLGVSYESLADLKSRDQGQFLRYPLYHDAKLNITIHLDVPKQLSPADEKSYSSAVCADTMSYLSVAGKKDRLAIPLSPFCSETYDAREVDIGIYLLPAGTHPLLSIGHNGPACIRAVLYAFNPVLGRYEQKAEACGG